MADHIFISYSHEDKEYVHRLAESLREAGYLPWIDDRIDYGSAWPDVIEEHVDTCRAFIVVVTTNARKSTWVRNEVARAQAKRKPIFPLLLEGDDWIMVQSIQRVDVRSGKLPPAEFYSDLAKYVPEDKARETILPAPVRHTIPKWAYAVVGTIMVFAVVTMTAIQQGWGPFATPSVPTRPMTQTVTVIHPTSTSSPTATHTPTVVPPTPAEPAAGATRIHPVDRAVYVYVPAGEFTVGSSQYPNEEPEHRVSLDAFWIMQTEVTNDQYAKCVGAGRCTPPSNSRWDDPKYTKHPVTHVTWEQANTYAIWMGGRLPSEAQWEKACRGPDGFIYPWGNPAPNSQLLNFAGEVGDTTPVGSYLEGASPYGALDMAGNVYE